MQRLFLLTFSIVLVLYEASAHRSLRIAAMIRGTDKDNTTSKIVGDTSHDCYRTCVAGDIRTCIYNFTIVDYTTMSVLCGNCPYTPEDCHAKGCITAGGDVRLVTVANRMLPGPSIQVCEGDIVQVNVINTLSSDTTSIHWHGIHQMGTPYMDGVPYLTQCPILPDSEFKYHFTANPPGTHMWHSHSGPQEVDGLHGSLVVRLAEDPLSQYYDYDLSEHIMIVWHWFAWDSTFVFKTMHARGILVVGHSLTINGLAATVKYERDGVAHRTPRAEFTVTQGFRYRFRLLTNTANYCPIQVSVDNHTMLVIAMDGAPFQPVEVDSLVISAGERYDFVLTADQEIGNYWIRYKAFGFCSISRAKVSGEAILRYNGADYTDPTGMTGYKNAGRSGVLLNPIEVPTTDYSTNRLIYIDDVNSTMSRQANVSGRPDRIIYLESAFRLFNQFPRRKYIPQLNNASFEFPRIPFLTQYDQITDDMYCTENDDSAKECFGTYCTCPYTYAVDTGDLVEMVIVATASPVFEQHPFHLHGHYFRVVAMENGNGTATLDDIKHRNEAGSIDKKLDDAPLKDTVGVPSLGFAVLRFVADNPGYWLFHCHVSDHLELGHAVMIKVGKHDEMARPPDGFPTCGNWNI